jgi:HEPN domain-containing protein
LKQTIRNWLAQSERDLVTAEHCISSGDFYASAFFCQQAVEKGLKALYINRFKKLPPKIHHIDKLARLLDSPDFIVDVTYDLSEDYMLTRYPDVSDELPYESYSKQMAEEKITLAKKVMLWIKENMEE